MTIIWLLAFSILTFSFSILYFYMFSRRQERFMQFWGLSWVAYSCSLFCLFAYLVNGQEIFLEVRKMVDMSNILLLLLGTYAFMHIKTPAYWYKFSLYLLLLAIICIYYKAELLSFYLPISLYQMIITFFICYNVYFKWDISKSERIIAISAFLFWGCGKAVLSIVEIFTTTSFNYILEIILSNVVNFCILTIYIAYTRNEKELQCDIYKTVIENTSDAIFYYCFEPHRCFEYVSPSVESLTGYKPPRFYDNPGLFKSLFMKSEDNIWEALIDAARSNKTYVTELARKNGELFWAEFTLKAIQNDKEKIVALEGTIRDVTQIKTAQLEQIEANSSRNNLLSYISHELRTPITSISGYLTALNDGTMSSPEDKEDAMEIITNKTMSLKKLVDDLDQLSKLETKQFTFEYITCTVGEVVQMMIDNNINDINDKDFQISLDYDMEELDKWLIIIDEGRINQVFSNLITNAVKYSKTIKNISIEFKLDEAKEHFLVSVHDSGIGISDENISHVFDKFYRGDARKGSVEGRGLGLTICKEILLAHRGDIYAESVYGQGSTFTFIIPLYMEV